MILEQEGLIDSRNRALWNKINLTHTFKIEFVKDRKEYGCYSKDNLSIIYVPESNKDADSFTHELLHVYLRQKQIFIGAGLHLSIEASPILNNFFSSKLIEHMGNCLDHIKILPIYLELGFDKRKFIIDFDEVKCTDDERRMLKNNFKTGLNYNSSAIDFFIGKVISIGACPNNSIDYQDRIAELGQLDSDLLQINQSLISNWEKIEIDNEDPFGYNSFDVIFEYCSQMEEWTKNKTIR